MTPAALKNSVLERLGVVPPGGPYPVEDVTKVTEKYVGLHSTLLAKKLATWAISEDVPDQVQEPLLAMLAFLAASDFGVPEPRYTRLRLEGALGDSPASLAERQLRQVNQQRYISSPVRSEYF